MGLLLIAMVLAEHMLPNAGVVFVPSKQVLEQVRSVPEASPGLRWVSLVKTEDYEAIVLRRTAPDRAEVHSGISDVWHVLEGGGTLVTGGSLIDGVDTEPGEVRGRGITGGESRHVGPGDFSNIPLGVPHWLSKIDGEIVYVIVKVKSRR
jgi:mannose-6-phosphate isomerase-like protein (cupin superfamily)